MSLGTTEAADPEISSTMCYWFERVPGKLNIWTFLMSVFPLKVFSEMWKVNISVKDYRCCCYWQGIVVIFSKKEKLAFWSGQSFAHVITHSSPVLRGCCPAELKCRHLRTSGQQWELEITNQRSFVFVCFFGFCFFLKKQVQFLYHPDTFFFQFCTWYYSLLPPPRPIMQSLEVFLSLRFSHFCKAFLSFIRGSYP